MLMNLTDVLTSEGKAVEKQVDMDIAELNCRLGDFPVIRKTPLTLTLTNLGTNKASIEGKMELTFAISCDRCLKSVNQKVILDFMRTVEGPDEYKEDIQEDDRGTSDESPLLSDRAEDEVRTLLRHEAICCLCSVEVALS